MSPTTKTMGYAEIKTAKLIYNLYSCGKTEKEKKHGSFHARKICESVGVGGLAAQNNEQQSKLRRRTHVFPHRRPLCRVSILIQLKLFMARYY